jgi:hypothetical protein
MWEEKARISEKALVKISADVNTERAKIEATYQEYLDKMRVHTNHAKHTLGLDKMLGRTRSSSTRRSGTSLCRRRH